MQDTCSRTSDITFRLWECTSLWSSTDGAATFTKGTELRCSPHYPYKEIRSASLPALLFVPASLTVTHGDRRFAVCSAVLWNNLTPSLRTAKSLQVFKVLLKTHILKH